ncbi:hypothetical protein MKX01_006757 [Papaver californicum]|nr:hypothetical protein MKX01_006757 [Papaver californicum]
MVTYLITFLFLHRERVVLLCLEILSMLSCQAWVKLDALEYMTQARCRLIDEHELKGFQAHDRVDGLRYLTKPFTLGRTKSRGNGLVPDFIFVSYLGELILFLSYKQIISTFHPFTYCTHFIFCRHLSFSYKTQISGALDGGIDIPHSEKRFAGYKKGDGKKDSVLDAEIHRKYIFARKVPNFQTHFSQYAKRNIDADGLEALYKKVHAAIRADPTAKKTEKAAAKAHKRYNLKKLTYDERKNKLIERLNVLNSAAGADDE